jgi:vacuolar-type H+-ATPase subunit I/STV1
MSVADTERELNRFVSLYEARESLKQQGKKLNQEYKQLNDSIHQFLLAQPENTKRISAKYALHLRTKTKTSGLNTALIGEGYVQFHETHGRVVAEQEKEAFLAYLKALRKTKTQHSQEVTVVVT